MYHSSTLSRKNPTEVIKYRHRVEVPQLSARQATDFASFLSEQQKEFFREYEKLIKKTYAKMETPKTFGC